MLIRQSEYLRRVGEAHRKEYGQYFTPPDVARFMVQWVLESEAKAIFDPAFGLGAFLEPIDDASDVKFTGTDVDLEVLRYWMESTGDLGAEVSNEDYLLTWGRTHSNIVCNPPYMRFQKFLNRDAVFNAFLKNLGFKLSGYTNTASAFLLKSISELDGTGRLAYIMPLEFLSAGYGTAVKSHLVEGAHLAAIIKLDCEKDVFPDAITSIGIVLYDASRTHTHVDFHAVDSVQSLKRIFDVEPAAKVPIEKLDPTRKWLPYFQPNGFAVDTHETVPLQYYGYFTRGIATGANEFFILRPSHASQLGISDFETVNCITRSSQIRRPVFTRTDYSDLVKNDAPVLLFNVNTTHSKSAAAYILHGERKGYDARFLTKTRNPWYKMERRQPAPLLLGVFSRNGYKIVRNRTDALNLTCFHGFVPNFFGLEYLDHLFLYLSCSVGRDIVSLSMRRYGDRLDKFEPNDVNTALVPSPQVFNEMPQPLVSQAVSYLEETGEPPSWIDTLFEKLKIPEN